MDEDKEIKILALLRSKLGGAYNWKGAIYLGLVIVTGAHPHYCVKHSLDVLLTLTGLAFLLWFFPALGLWSVGVSAVAYVIAVSVNRRRMHRLLRADGWTGKY